MTKRNQQAVTEARKNKKESKGYQVNPYAEVELREKVVPKNDFQRRLFLALANSQVVIGEAPAGTGKTFLAMSKVSDKLKSGQVKQVILSRPAVGMGNTLGLLKGGMREKFEPYLMALIDVLTKRYGHNYYETAISNKRIEFVPLEYLRGRSFEDSIVIIDEAQNTNPAEMYTILTRLGEGSQLICLGDRTQNDMRGVTGIQWAVDFSQQHGLEDLVTVVKGTSDDIVRSAFCKAVVKAKESEI